MGEFNDMIREQIKRTDKLILLARVYTAGVQRMILGVNVYAKKAAKEGHYVERMQEYCTKNFQDYETQLKKLRITGKGDIYYAEELYTEKDAIASRIKLHTEILTHMLLTIFCNQEDMLQEYTEYVKFLDDFMTYRRKL